MDGKSGHITRHACVRGDEEIISWKKDIQKLVIKKLARIDCRVNMLINDDKIAEAS
jgi:hypothetical protein